MGEAKRRRAQSGMTWTAGAHYTLIIEWLADSDRKTGTELAQRLQTWGSSVELRACCNAAEVLAALYDALEKLRTDGEVPVIHIEAHGLEAPQPSDDSGISGPDGHGGEEQLLWSQMAPLLGIINVESRFQLLLVGASCYGLTALDGFNIKQAAPFAALVGFATTVQERSLFEGMVELYRQLLLASHRNIPEAVRAANRELNIGEALITTSFSAFAEGVIRSYARHELEPSYRLSENERLVREKLNMGQVVSLGEMTRLHSLISLRNCQQAVRIWFAYDVIPENRNRFRIDVERIFNQERARHRRKVQIR